MTEAKSLFAGEYIPLDTVLYKRYNEVEELLSKARAAKNTTENGEKSRKKRKLEAAAAEAPTETPSKKEKEKKKDKKRKSRDAEAEQEAEQAAEEVPAAAVAQVEEAVEDPEAERIRLRKEKKEQKKKDKLNKENEIPVRIPTPPPAPVISGPANTEEAQKIRGVLFGAEPTTGVPSKSGKGFGFGFNMQEIVAAETEAKLENILHLDSSKDGYVPRKVYVCGMPHEYSEEDIREYWGYVGEIEELDCFTFPGTDRYNGAMFITFKTKEGYDAALTCDGEELEGRKLRVDRCKIYAKKAAQKPAIVYNAKPEKVPGYNVAYVGNLSFDVTDAVLTDLFKEFTPKFVRVHTDKETGRSKGFAHVHFESEEALDKAVAELDDSIFFDRNIKVHYAQPKRQ